MRLAKIIYRLRQSVLYIGDVLLAKSGKTPGCAKCDDIKPRLGSRLCASLPPAGDVDVVGLACSPEWIEATARLPGFRRIHSMAKAPGMANPGRYSIITPERFANPGLPPEALLHECDMLAERYIIAFPGCGLAAAGDYFTPNGIPVYYRRGCSPMDREALSILPDALFKHIEDKGGTPFPDFAPSGGAYAHTKENSAEIARFLSDFPDGRRMNSSDYAFAATHWALAFARGIA